MKLEYMGIVVYALLVKILRVLVILLYIVLLKVLREPVELSGKIKRNIDNENIFFSHLVS